MHYNEALAVARLRQWASNRVANLQGKGRRPNAHGWQRRDERTYDAALVRVLDFEKALGRLDNCEQVALVLRYRDKEPAERIAMALRCSVRTVGNILPRARRKLADQLDRMNLL